MRLPPAEAMRPPAPGRYRRTLLERLGSAACPPTPLRMILRNMERRPLRTALSIGGVAAAVAIVIMGNFFRDAIEVDRRHPVQPRDAQRRGGVDAEPVTDRARERAARLPGVQPAESGRYRRR